MLAADFFSIGVDEVRIRHGVVQIPRDLRGSTL